MHPYDPTVSGRRQPYPSQIPSMRPAEDHQGSHPSGHAGGHATGYSGGYSATPIYDALYAEYLRSFRALPGDRTGEEDLGFTGFGTGPYGARHHTPHYPSAHQHQPWQPQTNGRQHGQGHHFPAALPPAPRREH
ncbi:hypothetical protein ABT127_07270 [Streptomyces sp. NPDC001904]|uniref:hypothetical protein n=1 Tax=Streptomyces sp. NPDC001904 TaxID=3154531 RepID=UPI0033324525